MLSIFGNEIIASVMLYGDGVVVAIDDSIPVLMYCVVVWDDLLELVDGH